MSNKQNYIYRIDFLIGEPGRYYLGKHSTDAKWDSYTGSGVFPRLYFKKYGAKKGITYNKTILEYNSTQEKNDQREIEIIGDKWKTDPLCKNQKPGGAGSGNGKGEDNPRYGTHHSQETKNKISKALIGKPKSEHHKELCRTAALGHTPWNKGKTYVNDNDSLAMKKKWEDEEYRRKCTESHIGKKNIYRRKKVQSTIIDTGEEEQWDGILEATDKLGLKSHSNIISCLKGRRKQCAGRTWKYV